MAAINQISTVHFVLAMVQTQSAYSLCVVYET